MGGIGNGSVIASAIKDANSRGEPVEFVGYLNDRKTAGDEIEGEEVLGRLDQARDFLDEDTIPKRVTYATCELAQKLLASPTLVEDPSLRQFKELEVSGVVKLVINSNSSQH